MSRMLALSFVQSASLASVRPLLVVALLSSFACGPMQQPADAGMAGGSTGGGTGVTAGGAAGGRATAGGAAGGSATAGGAAGGSATAGGAAGGSVTAGGAAGGSARAGGAAGGPTAGGSFGTVSVLQTAFLGASPTGVLSDVHGTFFAGLPSRCPVTTVGGCEVTDCTSVLDGGFLQENDGILSTGMGLSAGTLTFRSVSLTAA